tara:strand:+ start:2803 stop:3594 length:792 start_codon:yes stop_codon:yes gene_type:complete
MKNMFGEKIKFMLENSFAPNLSILLEEEGDENTGDKEESSAETSDSILDDDDQDAGSEQESTDTDSEESFESTSSADEDSIDKDYIEKTSDKLTDHISGISQSMEMMAMNNTVTKHIRDFVKIGVNESYNKKSILKFLNEDDSTEKLEKSLDDYETLIQRGADLLDDQDDKTKNINVEKYVEAALHAIKHFDSLFNPFDIVLQSAKTALILDLGGFASKEEKVLEEFEEMLYSAVSEETDDVYEEYVLNRDKRPVASGAINKA